MSDSGNQREPGESATVRSAKRLFDESVERMDGATLSQLNRRRQRALAQLGAGREDRWRTWLPAAGAAAALAVAVFVWQSQAGRPAAPPGMATDFDILMEGESLEMLEDLEFYAWLEAEEPAPITDDHVG